MKLLEKDKKRPNYKRIQGFWGKGGHNELRNRDKKNQINP